MIKDSGERRQFDTGAVRDMQKGKGRCDLMPLDVVRRLIADNARDELILSNLNTFLQSGDTSFLHQAFTTFCVYSDISSADSVQACIINNVLQVAIHFEEGAEKYGEDNWKKGLPAKCYIDSAVRHYLKWLRGDTDERHDRAFLWNLMCCIWTCERMPELNNYLKDEEKGVAKNES